MKKLVLKTVAITLACIVGAFAVAFGAACLFAPKFVAGIFDGVGNYSASVFFYEKNYGKTEKFDDLVLLVDKLDVDADSIRAEKYLAVLLAEDNFNDFCSARDEIDTLVSTKDYYSGLYAVSLFYNEKVDDAMNFCEEYVKNNGYSKNNPLRSVLSEFSEAKVSELEKIRDTISKVISSLSSNQALAQKDLEDVNLLINNR